jgi:murein DD-endopeptidase MepM/ murein hydrolase activator NlpD
VWPRIVVLAAVAAVATGPVAYAGDGYGQQQAALAAKAATAAAKIAAARRQEAQLTTRIDGLTNRISDLETRVRNVAGRMSLLQTDLALRRRRWHVLDALVHVEIARANVLQTIYRQRVAHLDRVLVRIYKSPRPGALDIVLQAKSFQSLLDELSSLDLLSKQDEAIATDVARARHRVELARARTAAARTRVADEANLINARLEQVAVLHNELLTSKSTLTQTRGKQSLALTVAKAQEQAALAESAAIATASAQLAAKIRAASTAAPSATASAGQAAAPSAAGLIWPVSGPITSPFGPRWGGFHPGIDIGVPEGTPIHAAAAGTVIYCGWESGYGNLVVIDHHNGLATAYGHQSRIAVSCGANVAQGDVIGYTGCTGFCTGPHLHFEVRVNGAPVDPLGYLP